MDDAELRAWAVNFPAMPQAVAVLRLLDEAAAKDAALAEPARWVPAVGDAVKRRSDPDGPIGVVQEIDDQGCWVLFSGQSDSSYELFDELMDYFPLTSPPVSDVLSNSFA